MKSRTMCLDQFLKSITGEAIIGLILYLDNDEIDIVKAL